MPFPFASFGTLQFETTEMPLFGSDTLWVPNPKIDRATPLGAAIDDIQPLGPGSDERQWEAYFTPSRYNDIVLLVGTTALLVDFQRPVPNARMAYLEKFTIAERIGRGAPGRATLNIPVDATG